MKHFVALVSILIFLIYGSLMPREFIGIAIPEICDNAIDDDMDGLIDLNDSDCDCLSSAPSSLIPNPSFEETECCPQSIENLFCARNWIQASEATTDYLNTCGWFGRDDVPVPLPLPDGNAVIGFRNGSTEPRNPNFKEYAGSCLEKPLKAGVSYRLQFHVGFSTRKRSPTLTIALFGTTDCRYLPFGKFDKEHGCPLNGPGWTLLDSTIVSGENNWVQQTFNFTPKEDLRAVAIGPDCKDNQILGEGPYYYLDNLILAELQEFETTVSPENQPCSPEFRLRVQESDSVSFQWYLNGVAIMNANSSVLQGPLESGIYQVRLQGANSCKVSPEFSFSRPESRDTFDILVCDQNSYDYNGILLPVPGRYTDTLTTKDGCDSIVDISLLSSQSTVNEISAKIFPGETFTIGSHSLSAPLRDTFHLTTSTGCDSIVVLNLSYFQVYIPNAFTPNGDGINDIFTIYGDADLIEIETLDIFDRWGNLISRREDLDPFDLNAGWDGSASYGEKLKPGVFVFLAQLRMSDQKLHQLNGSVVLIR